LKRARPDETYGQEHSRGPSRSGCIQPDATSYAVLDATWGAGLRVRVASLWEVAHEATLGGDNLIKSAEAVAAVDATSEVGSLHKELLDAAYANRQAAFEMSAKAGLPTRGLSAQPAEAAAKAEAAAPLEAEEEEAIEDGEGASEGEREEEIEQAEDVEQEEAGLWVCRHCTLLNEVWRRRCRLCMRAVKRQGEHAYVGSRCNA